MWALVALGVGLAMPSRSDAGFNVSVYIDGIFQDSFAGSQDPDTNLWNASSGGPKTYTLSANDKVSLNLITESNFPGGATEAYVLDTTTSILTFGSASTQHGIKIIAQADPFTSPGVGGEQLYLSNTLTTLKMGSTLPTAVTVDPNGANIDIYGSVDPDNNSLTNNSVRTAHGSYSLQPSGEWVTSPTVQFTRGAQYSLASVIDITLAANKAAQVTTSASVVAPAPGGLILAATALPFVGLLRRRLLTPRV